MGSTKVTLRKREYPSGKVSLYLDFYPAINPPALEKRAGGNTWASTL